MTNEVKRSLGQKTRLFLDCCCFCGLLGQIRREAYHFQRPPRRPSPLSWRARSGCPAPCSGFSRDPGGQARRLGLVLKHNCYGDAVLGAVGGPAGSGGPERVLASRPGSPVGPQRTWPGAAPLSERGGGLLLRCLARPPLSSCNSVARNQIPLVAQEHHADIAG